MMILFEQQGGNYQTKDKKARKILNRHIGKKENPLVK